MKENGDKPSKYDINFFRLCNNNQSDKKTLIEQVNTKH